MSLYQVIFNLYHENRWTDQWVPLGNKWTDLLVPRKNKGIFGGRLDRWDVDEVGLPLEEDQTELKQGSIPAPRDSNSNFW